MTYTAYMRFVELLLSRCWHGFQISRSRCFPAVRCGHMSYHRHTWAQRSSRSLNVLPQLSSFPNVICFMGRTRDNKGVDPLCIPWKSDTLMIDTARKVTEAWACTAAQQMCAALEYIHFKVPWCIYFGHVLWGLILFVVPVATWFWWGDLASGS